MPEAGALYLAGVGSIVLSVTIRDSTFLNNESDVDETSLVPTGGTMFISNQSTSQVDITLANSTFAGG